MEKKPIELYTEIDRLRAKLAEAERKFTALKEAVNTYALINMCNCGLVKKLKEIEDDNGN